MVEKIFVNINIINNMFMQIISGLWDSCHPHPEVCRETINEYGSAGKPGRDLVIASDRKSRQCGLVMSTINESSVFVRFRLFYLSEVEFTLCLLNLYQQLPNVPHVL
jgi:hypothetical protein